MTNLDVLPLVAGALAGLTAGVGYLWLLRRSVRRLIADRRAGTFLAGAALRTAVPVAVLVGLATWNQTALLAGAGGLLLVQLVGRQWLARETAPPKEHP